MEIKKFKICKKCNCNLEESLENFSIRSDNGRFRHSCKKCLNRERLPITKTEIRLQLRSELISQNVNTCITCKETKELTNFLKSTNTLTGYVNKCKACVASASMIWRNKNKDYLKYYSAKQNFNISETEYTLLMQKTNCDMCKISLEGKRKNIDHCHTSGKIRGVLCITCNTGLGKLGDSIESLEKALTYLKSNTYA
jgi:hypothetical protein